jgi:hypothetical protein
VKRNSRGQIALDDIELEGGIVVKVRLDKETGIFHASYTEFFKMENGEAHGGESWSGKDLEKIRSDVRQWAKEKKALKWEPVIVIAPKNAMGLHDGQSVLGQVFDRRMRARKHKGDDFEWRTWAHSKPDGSFVYANDLEVYAPGSQSSAPSAWSGSLDPVTIEYTSERWLALLQLRDMERALQKRLEELVEGGAKAISGFLAKVPAVGLLGLSKGVQGSDAVEKSSKARAEVKGHE